MHKRHASVGNVNQAGIVARNGIFNVGTSKEGNGIGFANGCTEIVQEVLGKFERFFVVGKDKGVLDHAQKVAGKGVATEQEVALVADRDGTLVQILAELRKVFVDLQFEFGDGCRPLFGDLTRDSVHHLLCCTLPRSRSVTLRRPPLWEEVGVLVPLPEGSLGASFGEE